MPRDHNAPQLIAPEIAAQFLLSYFKTFFAVWGRTLDRAWEEAKEDFPNVILIAINAVSLFFSISIIPFQAALENFANVMQPRARWYRRYVITGDKAFELNVEFITRGTLRAGLIDQSFADMVVTFIAARIFTWISGGGALRRIGRLMGLSSYDDVLRYVKGSVTRQVALRAFSLMMTFFSIGYGVVSLVNLGLDWDEKFRGLQQMNKRVRGVQRNRVRARATNPAATLTARSKRAVNRFYGFYGGSSSGRTPRGAPRPNQRG